MFTGVKMERFPPDIQISMNGSLMKSHEFSASSSMNSTLAASVDSARAPVHAYGATALSASGRESSVVLNDFDPFPVNMPCPNCHQFIETAVKYKPGKVAFITGALVGIASCGICCILPCFLKPLKDAYHSCPRCGSTIGIYRRKTCCSR